MSDYQTLQEWMTQDQLTAIQIAELRIHTALDSLQPMFSKGCELTFVMRHPDRPECWLVISRDKDLREVAATVLKAIKPTQDTQVES